MKFAGLGLGEFSIYELLRTSQMSEGAPPPLAALMSQECSGAGNNATTTDLIAGSSSMCSAFTGVKSFREWVHIALLEHGPPSAGCFMNFIFGATPSLQQDVQSLLANQIPASDTTFPPSIHVLCTT